MLIERSIDKSRREILKKETFNAKTSDSLLSLAKEFIAETEGIDILVIAIAGFVENHEKVRITNIPHWPTVQAEEFKKELNIPRVFILNDFEANGYGV
jgi:glucokinase